MLTHISARVVSPKDRLREQAQKLDELFMRLERALKIRFEKRRGVLEQSMGKLDAMSPLRVLKRGYTLVSDLSVPNTLVKSVQQVQPGQKLQIKFYDGQTTVQAL